MHCDFFEADTTALIRRHDIAITMSFHAIERRFLLCFNITPFSHSGISPLRRGRLRSHYLAALRQPK
jgi:hypothetical protein